MTELRLLACALQHRVMNLTGDHGTGKAARTGVNRRNVTECGCSGRTILRIDPHGPKHHLGTMTGQGEAKPAISARHSAPTVLEATAESADGRAYLPLVSMVAEHDGPAGAAGRRSRLAIAQREWRVQVPGLPVPRLDHRCARLRLRRSARNQSRGQTCQASLGRRILGRRTSLRTVRSIPVCVAICGNNLDPAALCFDAGRFVSKDKVEALRRAAS